MISGVWTHTQALALSYTDLKNCSSSVFLRVISKVLGGCFSSQPVVIIMFTSRWVSRVSTVQQAGRERTGSWKRLDGDETFCQSLRNAELLQAVEDNARACPHSAKHFLKDSKSDSDMSVCFIHIHVNFSRVKWRLCQNGNIKYDIDFKKGTQFLHRNSVGAGKIQRLYWFC